MSDEPKITICGGFQAIHFPSSGGGDEGSGRPHFQGQSLVKGRALIAGEHLRNVREEREHNRITICASCLPETRVRQSDYVIEFTLDSTRKVIDGRCSCVAGISASCKHAAALFLFVNEERSTGCTDSQAVWKKPSKKAQERYPKGQKVEELFKLSATEWPSFKPSQSHQEGLAKRMADFGLTKSCLYKSLTADGEREEEDDKEENSLDTFPHFELLFNDAVLVTSKVAPSPRDANFYEEKVLRSHLEIQDVFEKTVSQAQSKRWFQERKFRISASKAHQISRAREEKTRKKYFFSDPPVTQSMRYGRQTEPDAKKKYEEETGLKVFSAGLVIKKEQPWLCATPDGLVKKGSELIVLEIKCPSSCQGKEISVPYLSGGKLLSSHQYYTQIQIQLYCCCVETAHFFVYSSADTVLATVKRDDEYL